MAKKPIKKNRKCKACNILLNEENCYKSRSGYFYSYCKKCSKELSVKNKKATKNFIADLGSFTFRMIKSGYERKEIERFKEIYTESWSLKIKDLRDFFGCKCSKDFVCHVCFLNEKRREIEKRNDKI